MAIDFGTPSDIKGFVVKDKASNPSSLQDKYYTVNPNNWYKALPFRFVYTDPNNPNNKMSVNLPISPSNLQISTRMGSIVTPSLYGIVEQHSEVRLYDITIQGVTGIAAQYSGIDFQGGQKKPTSGRMAHDGTDTTTALGGFLPEVTNMIKQAKKVADTVLGTPVPTNSGMTDVTKTGYYAFHELYKFFLEYKKGVAAGTKLSDKAPSKKSGLVDSAIGAAKDVAKKVESMSPIKFGSDKSAAASHPLQFINYKDGTQYDVVPVGFTLNRSANDPMMYEYSIRLIAYNLRSSDEISATAFEEATKAQLGLDGLGGSLFSNISNRAGAAATALSRIGILR